MDYKNYRKMRGAVLAEGAAAMVLLVTVIVGGIFLLMGAGTLMYYKMKLAYIADAGARAALQGRYWCGVQRSDFNPAATTLEVQNLVTTTLLPQMGLTSSSPPDVDLSNPAFVSVTVHVSGLKVLSGGMLPAGFIMNEKAVEPYVNDSPPARVLLAVAVGCAGAGNLIVPAYGSSGGAGPTYTGSVLPGYHWGTFAYGPDSPCPGGTLASSAWWGYDP